MPSWLVISAHPKDMNQLGTIISGSQGCKNIFKIYSKTSFPTSLHDNCQLLGFTHPKIQFLVDTAAMVYCAWEVKGDLPVMFLHFAQPQAIGNPLSAVSCDGGSKLRNRAIYKGGQGMAKCYKRFKHVWNLRLGMQTLHQTTGNRKASSTKIQAVKQPGKLHQNNFELVAGRHSRRPVSVFSIQACWSLVKREL